MSYVRIRTNLIIGGTAELNPADIDREADDDFQTANGDVWYEATPVPIAPSDLTIAINGSPTNARGAYVHNYDTTNFVTATFADLAGNACSIQIPAGRSMVIPGMQNTADFVLASDTAACICDVWVGMI